MKIFMNGLKLFNLLLNNLIQSILMILNNSGALNKYPSKTSYKNPRL